MIHYLVRTICCKEFYIVTYYSMMFSEELHTHAGYEVLGSGTYEECDEERKRIQLLVNSTDFDVCLN